MVMTLCKLLIHIDTISESVNQDRTKPFPGPNHCCLQAFKKPVPQKSRNAHEKHGTPNGTPGSQGILDSGEGVRAGRRFFWSMDDCEYQPQYCRAGWIFLMSNRVTSDISCVFFLLEVVNVCFLKALELGVRS